MLIGALQLQGRHYRESYRLSGNQIANYWTTYGTQEEKDTEANIGPRLHLPLRYAGFQSELDALRPHKPPFLSQQI